MYSLLNITFVELLICHLSSLTHKFLLYLNLLQQPEPPNQVASGMASGDRQQDDGVPRHRGDPGNGARAGGFLQAVGQPAALVQQEHEEVLRRVVRLSELGPVVQRTFSNAEKRKCLNYLTAYNYT